MLFMGQIGIHLQICCPLSNSGQAWNFKSVLTFTIELCVSCQLSNVLRAESRFTSRGMRSFFVTLFFGFFLLRTSLFSLGSSNSFNVVSLTLQNNHMRTLISWNSQIWPPLLTNFIALQISKGHFLLFFFLDSSSWEHHYLASDHLTLSASCRTFQQKMQ